MQEPHIKNNKAIILCSSGLDSSYNLLYSKTYFDEVKVIFFNYGQKSFLKEYEKIKNLCERINLELIYLDLPFFKSFKSSIISKEEAVPTYKNKTSISNSKPTEWVPNRNGVFINIASAFAENLGYSNIVVGFNSEEAELFPDNTLEFIEHSNRALSFSTLNKVAVSTFSGSMNKKEIVFELNKLLKIFSLSPNDIWSCYNSFEKMCGNCQSCVRLNSAIRELKLGDEWEGLFLV